MLADLTWAWAEQDPPSARGSRQGAWVCAPCRLSPWALVSGCSCLQHGTSAEPGSWPSKMCHVQQCSACPAIAHHSHLPHTPALQQEQTDRAWRQMDKPAHSLPCMQAERQDRDPVPEIHTWGKLVLAHRELVCAFGMLVSIHASQVRQNGVLHAIAAWCPGSGTSLVTWLLPTLGDAAPPGQAGGCLVPMPAAGREEPIAPDPALAPSRS